MILKKKEMKIKYGTKILRKPFKVFKELKTDIKIAVNIIIIL
jgi:hypothetical protein